MSGPPTTSDLVVVVAGTSWDGTWFPERHVALKLSERVPVLWVDPQISWMTALRDRRALTALREDRLRRVAPNILRLTPVTVPGVTRPLVRDVAAQQARRAVRRAIERIGARVQAIVVASLSDMLDVVPARRRVFYGTDDFAAGAALMGTDETWLQRLTDHQLARADVVVAISPPLRDKWSSRRPDTVLIPNGCDAEHFAAADRTPPPPDIRLPRPIAGFVGGISDRIDVALLEAVATTGSSLLLVGPRQRTLDARKLDALLTRPNVQWVGAKPFGDVPSYLGVIDVGLTPYCRSEFNDASFPLKTLEYLAAGRPVVATDLPAHRWLATSHVTIASTPADFAARTVERLAAPRHEQDVRDRLALGIQHSWARRTDEIARLIGVGEATQTAGEQAA